MKTLLLFLSIFPAFLGISKCSGNQTAEASQSHGGRSIEQRQHNRGEEGTAEQQQDDEVVAKPAEQKQSNTVEHQSIENRSGGIDSLLIQKINNGCPDLFLKKTAYFTSYNQDTKCPNWVAWRLTSAHTDGNVQRPQNAFHADENVPEPRVDWFDYKGSGYDRGHMCPAGDNKWSKDAMYETFLMTNMCPQNRSLNAGDWNEMEMKCREWAKDFGDVYIVCGPVPYKKPWETIGEKNICVPRAFFKVVLCTTGKPKAIGFIYKNIAQNNPKKSYVNSVRQVERITGIDFFSALPDDIENEVEQNVNTNEWNL